MSLLPNPLKAEDWLDGFLCDNPIGLSPEDQEKCGKKPEKDPCVDCPPEKETEITPFLLKREVPTNRKKCAACPKCTKCVSQPCPDVKACESDEAAEARRQKLERLKELYDSCQSISVESREQLQKATDTLAAYEERERTTAELLELKTDQLNDANERITEIEDGSWYDTIFYYVIPAVAIFAGGYVAADIYGDTEHPLN